MTTDDILDFDLITILMARVGRLNAPNRKLGLEVLAAAEPTSEQGMAARALLERPHLEDGDVPRELDVTGSMDAAFDFYERVHGLAEWSMFLMQGKYPARKQERKLRAEGPYHIQIELPGVLCCGDGWTKATCVVNGVLRAMLPLNVEVDERLMLACGEEEAVLLQGLDGLLPPGEGPNGENTP